MYKALYEMFYELISKFSKYENLDSSVVINDVINTMTGR